MLVHLPTKGMAYSSNHAEKAAFYDSVEDVYGAFSAYYDMPAVSFRWARWPDFRQLVIG
jgi:hypothetical protein